MGNCTPQARENGQDPADKTQTGSLTGSTTAAQGIPGTVLYVDSSNNLLQPCPMPRVPGELSPKGLGIPGAKAAASAQNTLGKVQTKHLQSHNLLCHIIPAPAPCYGTHCHHPAATREGEQSCISSVCYIPALHTASLVVYDPQTPVQHMARFVTMARHPWQPPTP